MTTKKKQNVEFANNSGTNLVTDTLNSIEDFRESGRRNNGNVWVYEVQNALNNRWIPDGTNVFYTRDEAREYVSPLRDSGLNVRIAKYSVAGYDRF